MHQAEAGPRGHDVPAATRVSGGLETAVNGAVSYVQHDLIFLWPTWG